MKTPMVLILVLMDGGIGEVIRIIIGFGIKGLNPCFEGWWYRRLLVILLLLINLTSLNPCFDGWWYRRAKEANEKLNSIPS